MRSVCCTLLFIVFYLTGTSGVMGQGTGKEKYRVVFYNTENLFDPSDDPVTNDEEFTPQGKNHWTHARLHQKVMMVYRALLEAAGGHLPDIIGLAEVENLWVVEYLVNHTPLQSGNYGIVHKESPDPRGIDVALLYRKERIKPLDYDFIAVPGVADSRFNSRDILHFKAGIGHETLHFFVNHWPSRSGGYLETKVKRELAAQIARRYLDLQFLREPQAKLLLMGDFNATPDEKCFLNILEAKLEPIVKQPTRLINLSQFWKGKQIGTIRTKGHWEIFDQFICSDQLLNGIGLTISREETKICNAGFLLEPAQRYLGLKPFRTYLGPVYQGGVSDHLPIATLLY